MRLILKKAILILCLLVTTMMSYGEEAIPESVISEGERRFNGSRDIFRGTLTDPDAWKVGRDEAVARMNAAFPPDCVGTILQARDNKWAITLKLRDPRLARKTIVDRERINVDGNDYLVIAQEKGIKVVDMKTRYEIFVQRNTGRR